MNQNQIIIEYCTGCRWLLRSAWFAQELLTTFEEELFEVCLRPKTDQAGHFQIFCNNQLLWCRKRPRVSRHQGAQKKLRDKISPKRQLGHLDR